nr:hypothetical protein [Thermosipho melanesiensis]
MVKIFSLLEKYNIAMYITDPKDIKVHGLKPLRLFILDSIVHQSYTLLNIRSKNYWNFPIKLKNLTLPLMFISITTIFAMSLKTQKS